jgi:hypothetical protein
MILIQFHMCPILRTHIRCGWITSSKIHLEKFKISYSLLLKNNRQNDLKYINASLSTYYHAAIILRLKLPQCRQLSEEFCAQIAHISCKNILSIYPSQLNRTSLSTYFFRAFNVLAFMVSVSQKLNDFFDKCRVLIHKRSK